MARRRRAMLKFLGNEKHSGTKVHTIGPGTVIIANHILRNTEVGDRTPAGNNDTITLGRSLEEECNLGDKCKYLNVHIQAGPRDDATSQNMGWIEWAIAMHKGDDVPPNNTNLGTNTLGDVVTKYLRNECILTGAIPVGVAQTNSASIRIKVPSTKIQLKLGDLWILYLYARTVSATTTATNFFRVITSYNFKNYH